MPLFLQFSFKFQNKFLSHLSVRPTKLKLDTYIGKLLIYCVHQLQAARIYLFLHFSSFFLSPISKDKNLLLQNFQHTSDGYCRGYVSFAHSCYIYQDIASHVNNGVKQHLNTITNFCIKNFIFLYVRNAGKERM